MKAQLIIPRPPLDKSHALLLRSKSNYRFPLPWTNQHPASHYEFGVLLDSEGEVLDGFMFRYLRDTVGAWIESDDPPGVARCLGVPWLDVYREDGIGDPPRVSTKSEN